MQCLKKAILLTCGILLLLTTYPQGMLIDCALNNYTEKYKVVDKRYKSENDYLIIDVIIPIIENLEGNPNIDKLDKFTGGAHGITTRLSYSVDNKTGKELQLSDLFKNGYDYKKVINFEIENAIQMDKDKYFTGKDGF